MTAHHRWAALAAGVLLLLGLTAGHERGSLHPPIQPRSAPLPTPARGDEEGREIGEREYLVRWLESRHRTAPGVDWRAIEEKNLLTNLALAASRPGPRPVWRERGPFNVTGSTVSTIVAADGKTLMLATSQGGVFSGVPGTLVWKRLADGLGGFVRGFTVSTRPEVWATAVVSRENGAQVYASRNRGVAWAPARGLPPLSSVYELLQDGDRRTVYLTARLGEDAGLAPILARSRDGGLSFTVLFTGEGLERPGIWTSRTARGPLYLLYHGRLEISNDQGSSFEPVSVVDGALRYAILRGSEAGGPTLYAAAGTGTTPQNLYVSEDGGQTWERRFRFEEPATIAPLFGGALAASIQDPNLVLFGGVEAWRSTDGGRSFGQISSWREYYGRPADRLHADINGLHFALYRGQEVLFLSTDGGTYQSTDGGLTVRNLTEVGLPNGQFYSTWSSDTDPDLFLAGTQDQGLQISLPPGRGARPGSPLFHTQLISGDYGNLTAASHDMSDVYAIYPTFSPNPGSVAIFRPGGDGSSLVYASQPAMTRSGFYAAAVADPDDPSVLYVAGDSLWRMRQRGDGTFAQERFPHSFSGSGSDYVIGLAIAPSDHNIWYAGTFLGRLWYSRDRGRTWSESETTRTALPFTSNSALLVATDDPFTCFAGGSGYGSPPVMVTRDGGVTWEPFDRGLPSTLVWSLAFDNPQRQRLYAATEAGPYAYDPAARTWRSLLGGGAPVARYYSVEGVPAAGVVRFGTFSRGIWDYVTPAR